MKRVGKKPVKSIPHRFPSPAGDSDSDFPPYVIAPGTPSAAMSLGVGFQLPDAEGTNAVAGPSTTHRRHSNHLPVDTSNIPEVEIIDIQGGRLKFYSAKSKTDQIQIHQHHLPDNLPDKIVRHLRPLERSKT